jgi:hypothetical protein
VLLSIFFQKNMDREWRILEFDSKILGVRVASVNGCVPNTRLPTVLEECVLDGVELAYYAPVYDKLSYDDDSDFPGILAAHSVVLRMELGHEAFPVPTANFRIESFPKGAPSPKVLELGVLAGKYSRFRRDPSISTAAYEAMYSAWVSNPRRAQSRMRCL